MHTTRFLIRPRHYFGNACKLVGLLIRVTHAEVLLQAPKTGLRCFVNSCEFGRPTSGLAQSIILGCDGLDSVIFSLRVEYRHDRTGRSVGVSSPKTAKRLKIGQLCCSKRRGWNS